MQVTVHGATAYVRATVLDENDQPVTGATATMTVTDRTGTVLASGASMTESAGGVYTYTKPAGLLPTPGQKYNFEVTATKGGNTGKCYLAVYNQKDTD